MVEFHPPVLNNPSIDLAPPSAHYTLPAFRNTAISQKTTVYRPCGIQQASIAYQHNAQYEAQALYSHRPSSPRPALDVVF